MKPALKILVDKAGKKFGRDWIFKNFTYQFDAGKSYAILGNNGSGKSTLLMSLSGFYALSKGKVQFKLGDKIIPDDQAYKFYALVSPMLELPEDLSIDEFLDMHFSLKPLKNDWNKEKMYAISGLGDAKNKQLKQLSSGMRQRVKLLTAFAADVPVLFLDEPSTNLDEAGIALYQSLVLESKEQLILVASNMKLEYDFCEIKLKMEELIKT